jgi:hypothetical protein
VERNVKFGKHAAIGLALDVFDWAGIGMIPGLGDIVDVGAALFWMSKLGPLGLTELLEVVPGADILPTNMVLGMVIDGRLARPQVQ